jgi:hypothetical protein
MKKLLFILISFALVGTGFGQYVMQTLDVNKHLGIPVIDTTYPAFKLGELRTRPQDSLTYRYKGRAATGRKWDLASGAGTVTSVAMSLPSFLSIAGSPVTSSGTLAITLSGTALPVANGGTGNTSLTAYALLAAGTTSTGALQQVSGLGTSGQVLTSNGAGALPTWQNPSGGTSDLTAGAIKTNIHIVNDADYTVASTDYIILYKTMSAGRTLTLPSAASSTNRMLIIKNGGGGGFTITTSVTIRESSSTTSTTIGTSQSVGLCSDGTDWWVLWVH